MGDDWAAASEVQEAKELTEKVSKFSTILKGSWQCLTKPYF